MSIKLTAFMTSYKFRKTTEEKEKMILDHIKNEYVPFEVKADVAKAIVKACYWRKEKDINGNEYSVFHLDSVAKYMLTCMAMIDLYTDIERTKNEGKIVEEFNILNEFGILDFIIKNVNQRELKEFNMVLQMTCDDLMTNEYENHAFISKQINRFGNLVGTTITPILKELDINKIKEIVGEIANK